MTRPPRRAEPPLTADLSKHIFAKRPRCKKCGSADLKTYKSLPKYGDCITRYVHCDGCGADYILMLD